MCVRHTIGSFLYGPPTKIPSKRRTELLQDQRPNVRRLSELASKRRVVVLFAPTEAWRLGFADAGALVEGETDTRCQPFQQSRNDHPPTSVLLFMFRAAAQFRLVTLAHPSFGMWSEFCLVRPQVVPLRKLSVRSEWVV